MVGFVVAVLGVLVVAVAEVVVVVVVVVTVEEDMDEGAAALAGFLVDVAVGVMASVFKKCVTSWMFLNVICLLLFICCLAMSKLFKMASFEGLLLLAVR